MNYKGDYMNVTQNAIEEAIKYMRMVNLVKYNEFSVVFIKNSINSYDVIIRSKATPSDKHKRLIDLGNNINTHINNVLDIMSQHVPDAEIFIKLMYIF